MAKKKAAAREYVWLQCTECGDLNYRTQINVKGGIDGPQEVLPPPPHAHDAQDQEEVERAKGPNGQRAKGPKGQIEAHAPGFDLALWPFGPLAI